MLSSPRKALAADVTFSRKSSEKYTHFVPGETCQGTAFCKLSKAQRFKAIHLEVIGTLSVKDKFNPEAKKPEQNAHCSLDRVIARFGQTYDFKYGNDTVRNITFSFDFPFPFDLPPSFEWTSPQNTPNSVSGGSLRYTLFLWLEDDSVSSSQLPPPRSTPLAPFSSETESPFFFMPPSSLCTESLEIAVCPQHMADMMGLDVVPGTGRDRSVRPREATVERMGKSGDKTTIRTRVTDTEAGCMAPGKLSLVVSIDNGNRKKTVDGLLFELEEESRVDLQGRLLLSGFSSSSSPPPPPSSSLIVSPRKKKEDQQSGGVCSTYLRVVSKDRPQHPVWVDKQSSGNVKHTLDIEAPRGKESVGCLQNVTISTPWVCVQHRLKTVGMMKGAKDHELTNAINVYFYTAPKERFGKEYKL